MTDVPVIGGHVSDGVSGKISAVQIWNPSDSGVVFRLENIHVAWTAMASVVSSIGYNGFDFNYYDQPISGTGKRYMTPKLASMIDNSPIELRIEQFSTPYPSSKLVYEMWPGPMSVGQSVQFTSPVILNPGMGFLVRSAQNQTYTIVGAQGVTTPVIL